MTVPTGPAPGFVVVDKPSGLTSHDVVARARRMAGTRRVGHAGTLDPMATGVLVLGVERATKLLGHLALTDKAYEATIRLGQSTVTDDAEGAVISSASTEGVTAPTLAAAIGPLTGAIRQVPSKVSAIKVEGKRSYQRVRDGEDVQLAARAVTVSRFDVLESRTARASDGTDVLEVDVVVECSTGTYVRALARDLGQALGVGGHLTRLRRTRVGAFGLEQARTLEQLEQAWEVLSVEDVVSSLYPRRDVDDDVARAVRNGGRLELRDEHGPVAVFAPDGRALAIMEPRDGALRPLVILAPA